jgi:hypothetical protein
MRFVADWLNSRAMAAHDRGDVRRAMSLYEKAAKADSSWSVPWYNLGLLAKERRDWKVSRHYNQEAVRRDPANQAAWWNLGIAATALSDWTEARHAWSSYGIKIPEGSGEIIADLGSTPIRINPQGNGEVIWSRRIDPARAFISSVPLPESRHRHGDLILHDGAPNGYRMLRGREVAVFDEIEILSPSRLGTFETTVVVDSVEDLAALERIFGTAGAAAEDWSSIRYICKRCTEGHPHDGHDLGEDHAAGERHVGIAASTEEVASELLRSWSAQTGGRQTAGVTTLLPPER